jgi:hypothetical protein
VAGKAVLELSGDNSDIVVPYENFYFRIDSSSASASSHKPRKASKWRSQMSAHDQTGLLRRELIEVFRQLGQTL